MTERVNAPTIGPFVIVASGDGDGAYPVSLLRDDHGRVIAAQVDFYPEGS